MKMHIPIPEGLQLPEDATTKPFKLDGMFIVMNDKLMPVEIGGYPVSSGEEKEDEEEGGYSEKEMSGEEESCEHGGEYGMCDECSQKGGKGKMDSFIIAIERALAKPTK